MTRSTGAIIEYEARLLLQVDDKYGGVPSFTPARNKSGRKVWRASASANSLGFEPNPDGSVKRITAYNYIATKRVEVTDDNIEESRRGCYFSQWEYNVLRYGRERFAADLADRLATAGLAVEVRCSQNRTTTRRRSRWRNCPSRSIRYRNMSEPARWSASWPRSPTQLAICLPDRTA